jgi:hypothetical protein
MVCRDEMGLWENKTIELIEASVVRRPWSVGDE